MVEMLLQEVNEEEKKRQKIKSSLLITHLHHSLCPLIKGQRKSWLDFVGDQQNFLEEEASASTILGWTRLKIKSFLASQITQHSSATATMKNCDCLLALK